MIKALIWNIRSVRTQKAFQRVQMLHKYNTFDFIALLEPFQHVSSINRYKMRLRMSGAYHNCNGKIWLFTNHGLEVSVLSNSDQQITILMQDRAKGSRFHATIVYTKCHNS